ncbi:MAG: DUF1289 domain-containing protein [Pseudomonadota bacterium]|nr:DUF1289 domain-containing protein [Pseudomonadota bacterium]
MSDSKYIAVIADVKSDGAECDAKSVPSPCVNICRMTPDRSHCEGCFRTLQELRAWRDMTDADKRAVWALIAERSGGAVVWME